MEETEYDKHLKQAKESEDFIARAIESIKRDYRSAIMPSLKNINKTATSEQQKKQGEKKKKVISAFA